MSSRILKTKQGDTHTVSSDAVDLQPQRSSRPGLGDVLGRHRLCFGATPAAHITVLAFVPGSVCVKKTSKIFLKHLRFVFVSVVAADCV